MIYSTKHFEFIPIHSGKVSPNGELYSEFDEFIVKLYQDPICADAFRPNVSPYMVQSVTDIATKFPNYCFYVIWDKCMGVPIGVFYYFILDAMARSVETGWVLIEDYRGGVYSFEVFVGGMKFLFEHENYRRIQAKVLDTNPYLKKFFLSHGATYEGTLRQASYRKGEYIDVHILSFLKHEYLERYKEK